MLELEFKGKGVMFICDRGSIIVQKGLIITQKQLLVRM